MTALEELLEEFVVLRQRGRHVSFREVVEAIVGLEPRQAEATCLVLWALPRDLVVYVLEQDKAELLAKRKGYSTREAGRQMGISHVAVGDLVDRAKPNIVAWLLELKPAPRNIS